MDNAKKLDRLLSTAIADNEPPEVQYEILHAIADAREDAASVYRDAEPEIYGRTMKSIEGIRRSALSMVPCFGRHQADAAWLEERACLPWWKRLWVGTTATQEFRHQWSAEKRAYGRDLVMEALA